MSRVTAILLFADEDPGTYSTLGQLSGSAERLHWLGLPPQLKDFLLYAAERYDRLPKSMRQRYLHSASKLPVRESSSQPM